jgi:hypothetical protein
MTTIVDLLAMPIGQEIKGFIADTKTIKKKWLIGDKDRWVQQVVLTDKTGDILTDILLAKTPYGCDTIHRCARITVVSGQMQAAEKGSKLFISEYKIRTQTADEYTDEEQIWQDKWNVEVKGKIRHGVVCSYIKAGKPINKPEIEALVKYVMEGGVE